MPTWHSLCGCACMLFSLCLSLSLYVSACMCLSASCSCPCRRMCHISLLLHYDIYLWSRALNTIRRRQRECWKTTCTADTITGLLSSVSHSQWSLVNIFTECSCMYISMCVCVCVTFVESLWLLLAPLAYFNNIYVYLSSLCALPSAVLCFPYKLSRTTLEEKVQSGSWSCK